VKQKGKDRKGDVPSLIPYEAVIDTYQMSFRLEATCRTLIIRQIYREACARLATRKRLRTLNRILLSREHGGWRDAAVMRPRSVQRAD